MGNTELSVIDVEIEDMFQVFLEGVKATGGEDNPLVRLSFYMVCVVLVTANPLDDPEMQNATLMRLHHAWTYALARLVYDIYFRR